ncbi:hypothetical protein [Actinokineospora bangkokensis]|uniref:hypothetical protein n=1 Tax=Actinokineospora bangkokensis TaxID=1193682 RepID=UPI001300FFB8|nr:hypothetical protein [Actinokineospora bangkokensis]
MIDSLGDIARTLDERKPPALNRVYRALDVNMVYQGEEQAINVMACSRVASACVRGGT